MRSFYKRKLFWILFGVPNLLSILYFGAIASPQYVSRSSLIIYQSGATVSSFGGLPLWQNSGVSLEGGYLVRSFIKSWQCFKTLDSGGLRSSWSSGDFITGFGGVASLFNTDVTSLYHYYRGHVHAHIDTNSAIVTIRVVGYDPGFALKLNQDILNQTDKAISNMNAQAYQNAQALFQNRLQAAKADLKAAIMGETHFQKGTAALSSFSKADQLQLALINQLVLEKIAIESRFPMLQNNSSGSTSAQLLLAQVNKIDDEIDILFIKIQSCNKSLNSEGKSFVYNQTLVQDAASNLLGLERRLFTAQRVALQHQYFIEYVSKPSVLPNPTSPARLQWIFGIMAATFLFYLIVKPSI